MCPIETPEGSNIGLISYLATFAKINEYGFIEAPYLKVDKATGRVTENVEYMSADTENDFIVAQANEPLDEQRRFVHPRVNARYRDQILEIEREKIDYMDVSPKMVVSVATAMIPFLENDDANRALMGSNMQGQAVPLLVPNSPLSQPVSNIKPLMTPAWCQSPVTPVSHLRHLRQDRDQIRQRRRGGLPSGQFMRSKPGHLHQPAPDRRSRRAGRAGAGHRRRPAKARARSRSAKRADRLYDLGGLQLRGRPSSSTKKSCATTCLPRFTSRRHELDCRDTKLGPEEVTRDIPNVAKKP
jgi:DNA-directed RNA polymerase subunit beta